MRSAPTIPTEGSVTDMAVCIDPALAKRFASAAKRCRIILFSAPCGCGKTTAATALLQGKTTDRRSARDPDCLNRPVRKGCEFLLLDDLQMLDDETQDQELVDFIVNNEKTHFVLLTRGIVPGCLMPFQLTGAMRTFGIDDLLLSMDQSRKLLESQGTTISPLDMIDIQKETNGYPIALRLLADRLKAGEPYCTATLNATRRDIFRYFDEMVYRRFDRSTRDILLCLAPFESFTPEMAEMISSDPNAGELLRGIEQKTTMLVPDGLGGYRFQKIFHLFLSWRVPQEYSQSDRQALYERAGLYYEGMGEIVSALDCYSQGGCTRKVTALLERHAAMHPGAGHYYETERFYRALPEEEILRSPTLMSGMSMLCALTLDFDGSEEWYAKLRDYFESLDKGDVDYREARTRLAFLDISLPQRGSTGLIDLIGSLFTILTKKEIELPAFSVTSTLPSIMSGGKDFSDWSKRDDLLYTTMKKPVEVVLGRDGVGLADCAICESKFEKGEDVSSRLLGLVSHLGEIQSKGTPDIEFATAGLLARERVSQGRADDARDMMTSLRERFASEGLDRFLPNMDALLCRIDLRLGDSDSVERWLRDCAPRDPLLLRPLWRYQYLTLAMVDIVKGELDNALIILAPLETYCERCSRTMDLIHIGLLKAICHYRQGNEVWTTELGEQLDRCLEYRFIWPVVQYGTAILPLLSEYRWKTDEKFRKKLIAVTREQAVYYPRFLQENQGLTEPLSAAETQVLRLVCHDMSNREIGDTLGISLATVKTHMSHILQKLGVNRRSEAKAMAEKLGLV